MYCYDNIVGFKCYNIVNIDIIIDNKKKINLFICFYVLIGFK